MTVSEAAAKMLELDPLTPDASEVTNRQVVYESASGRSVVCTDSIAFALPEDQHRNVLVTAGHTGRSSVRISNRHFRMDLFALTVEWGAINRVSPGFSLSSP